jgi:sensor histidine kinase regulating citrate/malate metabolism
MKIKRMILRLLVPSYIQFFLCILFWIGAGLGIFSPISKWLYVLMTALLACSLVIIFSAIMIDKFYLSNISENLSNLEQLNLKLRSQRHEYLNEMQVVYGLLELEEYEEAMKYLKPVYNDIAKVSKALRTSKPAVNALLQAKMEKAEKNNVQLYVEVSSNLALVPMEQWDLCKILGNLIDNAITAVQENKEEKKVHVVIGEDSNGYILSIYNNGPVIPESKGELIFKKGYTSKKEEGHGLGLGIVNDIVHYYHGTIQLNSREGKTEFIITLPRK